MSESRGKVKMKEKTYCRCKKNKNLFCNVINNDQFISLIQFSFKSLNTVTEYIDCIYMVLLYLNLQSG